MLVRYAEQLRELAKLTGYDYIRISHAKDPLPFEFVSFYADFLGRAMLAKSVLTNIPNGEYPVYKYAESGKTFNLPEIAVHFREGALS
jgi:hypothetical protein